VELRVDAVSGVIPANVVRKTEALRQLRKIAADPLQRAGITDEDLVMLAEYIHRQLIHSVPNIPLANPFGENIPTYSVRNWGHLAMTYEILTVLVKDPALCRTFISSKFLSGIIRMLRSPVREEREEIEQLLMTVMDHMKGARRRILQNLLSIVINCLEGERCIGMDAILSIFQGYFKKNEGSLNQRNFLLFRTAFFPLFATDYAFEFEKQLTGISRIFQRKDPATTCWCLKYLVKHFPHCNHKKQPMFLRQIDVLLPSLPASAIVSLAPDLIHIVCYALRAPALDVVMPALFLADDPGFMGLASLADESVKMTLYSSVKVASTHWKSETAAFASDLLTRIAPRRGSGQMSPVVDEERSKRIWNEMKSSVFCA
jgi:hypothetical protein